MLLREKYLKHISDSLATFQRSIEYRASISLLDQNIVAEEFCKRLLNVVYGYQLINLNHEEKNKAGIDLGDEVNGIAFQITSTKTSQKIESTIEKFISAGLYEKYPNLRFLILADKQKSYKHFDTQNLFSFVPKEHVLDFKDVLLQINVLDIKKLKAIGELLDDEFDINKQKPHFSSLSELASQVHAWFETLGYSFESYVSQSNSSFEWIINIPHPRRGYERILIKGIEGVAEFKQLADLKAALEKQGTDEGWLISARRIAQSVRSSLKESEFQNIYAYTFDELLDHTANFSGYIAWLNEEVEKRKINEYYVPLACVRDEIDSITKNKMASSSYDERNGWIEGYINQWLDDPAKEHISVLGEFGTGKTWFALHYAWLALQKYVRAKENGTQRPRLPIYIPLSNYAKAVNIESLFLDFFFRKHIVGLPSYAAFEQLNRMGKLLIIFDGFDEMASQIDRQKMINNFWELAKAVVPNTKVILTCRTEHFPEAKEGRSILGAELKASTSKLTGESPQFEVLEIKPLNDAQIRNILSKRTSEGAIKQVSQEPELLELARRPVMIDLILESLPDLESGQEINLSRIYLYAIRRKLERDIKSKRTFTSLADKLFFLCELSWEMLNNDQMKLNYRDIPDRIKSLFPHVAQESKDIDHWQYDMMGQSMLVRDENGDYSPAHRSFLEFFVAYKFAAELGILHPDFVSPVQFQSHVSEVLPAQAYKWYSYFHREIDGTRIKLIAPLQTFIREETSQLKETFGKQPITSAVITLMKDMVLQEELWHIIEMTRNHTFDEVGYIGGNAASILRRLNSDFRGISLERCVIVGANLMNTDLSEMNLRHANLEHVDLSGCKLTDADFRDVNLKNIHIRDMGKVEFLAWSPSEKYLASVSDDANIRIWDTSKWEQLFALSLDFSETTFLFWTHDESKLIVVGKDTLSKAWETKSWRPIDLPDSLPAKPTAVSLFGNQGSICIGDNNGRVIILDNEMVKQKSFKVADIPITEILVIEEKQLIVAGLSNGIITVIEIETGNRIGEFIGTSILVTNLAFDKIDNSIISYKKDHEIVVEMFYVAPSDEDRDYFGDPNTDSIEHLLEEYLDEALDSIVDWYYKDFKDEFEEEFAEKLSKKLTQEELQELKREFAASIDPSYHDEAAAWAEEMARQELENMFGNDSDFVIYNKKTHRVGFIEKWDLDSNKRTLLSWGPELWGHAYTYLPSVGSAITPNNGNICIWDPSGKQVEFLLVKESNPVLALSQSSKSKRLASGGADSVIRIWDVNRSHAGFGNCLAELKIQMNCKGLKLSSARGLGAISPTGDGSLGAWLEERGAILLENTR